MADRFQENAARHPDRLAVIAGPHSLTYRELNQAANRVAWELRNRSIGPEYTVAVRTRRDENMAIAALAVAKSGGCFLPLDPEHPLERQSFMAGDANAGLVLESPDVPSADLGVPVLRTDAAALAGRPVDDPPATASDDNLLYLLYTSGSTGRPKAIAMHHGPQVDLMEWSVRAYQSRPVALHYFPITSDVGYFELFAAWSSGGTVVVADEEQRFDVGALADLITRHRVDKALLPLAALDKLTRHLEDADVGLPSLREVITTGERQVITPAVRRMFDRMPHAVLDNHYGSTEVNVVTSLRLSAPATEWQEISPVGRPMGRARIYVLDDDLLPCPVGVPGTIHIGGPPPARGYAGRPALTAAAFVPDPFSPVPGARMYRIGDVGRWRPDGTLECLGRADFQVKVHGYRVEPGEIEATLRERADIAEAAVVPAEPGADDPRLVAYVVPAGRIATAEELRAHVASVLPAYLVPRSFVVVDRLPLSANGKLDRERLPVPDFGRHATDRVLSATEDTIAGIWSAVLGVAEVRPENDFFGLGGHSLLVAQVVHRIRAALAVDLPLRALFETPTLADLAARVDREVVAAEPELRPREHTGRIPLSYAQRRLWFLDRMYPGSGVYNNVLALRLRGPLDVEAVVGALEAISARHDVLRSRFLAEDGEPYRLVEADAPVALRRVDLSGTPEAEMEDAARRLIDDERARPIDLAAGPVARHLLVTLAADDHLLCLLSHHMVSDARTDALYVRELGEFYAARRDTASPPPLSYADYTIWQRELEAAGVFQAQLEHWREALEGVPPALALATDFPRPATLEEIQQDGRTHHFTLPDGLVDGLAELSREANASLFMTTLSLFGILLAEHTLDGQRDLVIGVPVEGRPDPRFDEVMGMFVNTLPFRVPNVPDRTFRENLHEVRDTALSAFANQDIPFEHLVERLQPERDLGRSPIFQVLFQLQYEERHDEPIAGVRTEPFEVGDLPAKFDLSMGLVRSESGMRGVISYSAALFTPETAARLAERFARLAAAVVEQPDRLLGELDVVTPAEWNAVLREWNDTGHAVPDVTLPELVEHCAKRTPDAVAVEFGDRRTTYRELNAAANALARALVRRGVGPERVVAVVVRRSTELVVALLAVLKAGGAYLPVDPDHPRDRVAGLITDSSPVLAITTDHDVDLVRDVVDAVVLDDPRLSAEVDALPLHDLADAERLAALGGGNAAYVLHTSGSTGRPKGVVVSHASIVNRLLWTQKRFQLDATDRVLHKTALTFDVSVWELFWPLTACSRLVIAEPGRQGDPAHLVRLIRERGVTTAHFVPSVLRLFLAEPGADACGSLRRVLSSGEALTPSLRDDFYRVLPAELHNLYGPTEAAIDVTHHHCAPTGQDVPIGRPVWNTRLYVLDEHARPVTPGTTGELHIGGAQVARGYLGRPGLTAERFVPDPFGPQGSRLYRTGDQVRLGHDGELRFLGRLDDQVKIRGVRVEPGEVESTLEAHPDVTVAAVVALPDADDAPSLVAYVTGIGVDAAALADYLSTKLPAHFVPSHHVVLDELPLTPSGKVDRRRLPAPVITTGDRPPRGPVEEILCALFRRTLGVDRVGIDDSFFALGGHSLSAVRLISRIRSALGVEVDIRSVFASPSPAGLARVVADSAPAHRPPTAGPRPDRVPLSHAQRRLWFLDRLEERSTAYNMSWAFRLRGPVDPDVLRAALRDLVARHENLRTTFPDEDGVPYQRILTAAEAEPELQVVPSDEESLEADLAMAAAHTFDLAHEPPLRCWLFRLDHDHHVLLLVQHHIASDGWSSGPLLRDLSTAYDARLAGREPGWPPLAVQYADYTLWQNDVLDSGPLADQLAYWTTELADLPDRLDLPFDRPPGLAPAAGGSVPLIVEADLHARIGALAESNGATVFMVLQAAFAVLLSRVGAGRDIPLGVPVAGRRDEALDDLVGLFVNTLVLRTDTSGDPAFTDLLARTRATHLAAYAHPDVPFERLVEELKPVRSVDAHPLFQVMLSFHNAWDRPVLSLAGVESELVPVEESQVKYDLSVGLAERRHPDGAAAGLTGRIAYRRALFDPDVVRRLADRFILLLEAVTEDPDLRIGDVDLLLDDERGLLARVNDTVHVTPDTTLAELFEAAAARHPDVAAVVFGGATTSYRELDESADRLARSLVAAGARPGEVVAIVARPSVESVRAVLAVAKTGAAFLAVAPELPGERLRHVLTDAAPVVTLVEPATASLVGDRAVLPIDGTRSAAGPADADRPARPSPDSTAYVVYTSGSTGRPKGVAGTNRSLLNRLSWAHRLYPWLPGEPVVAKTSFAFVDFIAELLGPLSRGASVVLADEEEARRPDLLAGLVARHGVRRITVVPSLLAALLDLCRPELLASCVLWTTSGEPLPPALAERFADSLPGARLVNLFGASETGADSLFAEVSHEVTIGAPIWNTTAYALDGDGHPVAPGSPGELYVGGPGLAHGYPGQAGLTAERFVPDPFGPAGGRLYRTGDLVRLRADGRFTHLGRLDDQVKVRGVRGHLSEVEAALVEHERVRAAAVTAVDAGELTARLVAHVVLTDAVTDEELAGHLRDRLPDQLVPSAFVVVDRLPMTPTGKLDRRALPVPPTEPVRRGGDSATPVQREVAEVWRQVLDVPEVRPDDDFFALGGHSLLVPRLVARIEDRFGVVVPLQRFFSRPTVTALTDLITGSH
ncbi:amino acid adenylation domain-containing protein [Actinosynnema pretiosum subsp. pretiosum]|uniref:Amino acid adenylation domain-containing protein n=1 Tax=Actinosynnema pretiosum subsp. pretiosum TaxID=103721 RepID=A0AA45L6A7_9PSEU|nr:Siderophore biosynthesis, non-ribosomal peptide synthetase [Actinosynnema pretiosum subsp. pretiosum]QUF04077.1 amino acid adenylation domain-containing protein [Actinosynnema pretiosum subsp. pretiosum]